MFSWQNAEPVAPSLEGVSVQPLDESIPFAKFDLTLTLGESGDQLAGSLNYATALYDRATIERLGGYLTQILSAMTDDSRQAVDSLDMLPAHERHKLLVEWNDTATAYPAERCIHELFEARAAEAPDADAVLFEGQVLGYRALNQQANRLALMADDGLARAINPSHTIGDGDTVFALATGRWDGEPNMTVIGGLAAEALSEAIVRAATQAASSGGLASARDTGTVPVRLR